MTIKRPIYMDKFLVQIILDNSFKYFVFFLAEKSVLIDCVVYFLLLYISEVHDSLVETFKLVFESIEHAFCSTGLSFISLILELPRGGKETSTGLEENDVRLALQETDSQS